MGPGRDQTRNPWIDSYRLHYIAQCIFILLLSVIIKLLMMMILKRTSLSRVYLLDYRTPLFRVSHVEVRIEAHYCIKYIGARWGNYQNCKDILENLHPICKNAICIKKKKESQYIQKWKMRQMDSPDKNNSGLIPQYLGVMPITQQMGLDAENLSSGMSNSNSAGQPAHPHRLISPFVVHIISKLATGEISIF